MKKIYRLGFLLALIVATAAIASPGEHRADLKMVELDDGKYSCELTIRTKTLTAQIDFKPTTQAQCREWVSSAVQALDPAGDTVGRRKEGTVPKKIESDMQ